MADLVLDWTTLGTSGTGVTSATVDTGGVSVSVTVTAEDEDAQAFTVDYAGYVPDDSEIDPNSHLKLYGAGGDGTGVSATSTTVLEFSSSSEAYGNEVENVSFILNDVDSGTGGDLADIGGVVTDGSFEDNVTILAYDADGNPCEVTMTSLGSTSVSGDTATGEETTDFDEANGSVQVSIAGPVARIEIVYENGGESEQGVLVSDVCFSTTDYVDDEDQDPVAVDDTAETEENVSVVIDVLSNDSDPQDDELTVTGAEAGNGTVTINDDGTLTYTPDEGYIGDDSISYTISDPDGNTASATVTVSVTEGNEDPVANPDTAITDADTAVTIDVLANDTDEDGDTLTVSEVGEAEHGTVTINDDGTITYTPDEGYTGEDLFTYTVDDGNGGHSTTGVTVSVGESDDGVPVAFDDLYEAETGATITFDPTDNDIDPDGDTLTITSIGDPENGTATLNDDGTVTYVSDAGFTGYDTFYYSVTDPDGNESTAVVTVEVVDGQVVPCFTPGTLIATPEGERLVEDLKVGDRVITRDNGIQEIRWVGRKELTGFDLARRPHMRPILIQQGALGNNLPAHDLLVSPQHRVLVANDKTALYFEEREVLAAAKHLTGLEGVDEVGTLGVTYIHFMFDNHEVVLSNGAWTESFQPGDQTLRGIGEAQRKELFELFPELEQAEGLKSYGAARRSLKRHEAELLTR